MKWTCSVCGYTHEGDQPPEKCPQCGVPAEKFNKVEEGAMEWAAEHVVGVAEGVDEEIVQGLRDNFNGECSEVHNYFARHITINRNSGILDINYEVTRIFRDNRDLSTFYKPQASEKL